MFFLAETPKALLDHASVHLARIRDLHARHWLICPGRGRSEYLLQKWAQLSGIASHAQEIDLRVLLEQIAATGRAHFDFDKLRLAVCDSLPRVAEAHPGALPLQKSLPLTPVSASVLSWSSVLAKVLDDTMQCREGEARWGSGAFLEYIANDTEVSKIVATHPGALTEQEFEVSIQAWIQTWQTKGGVPHLWIQLDAGLALLQFRRLLHLVETLEKKVPGRVHLFALAPSQQYWAHLKLRSSFRKTGMTEKDPDTHPGGLLWAFGRYSQDLQKQLADTLQATGDGGVDLESPAPKDNLLGWLQRSCREASPTEATMRPPITPGEASLTVHSTHTRLREMEVCRDRILQALREIPDLRYEEILLLLTNPKEQAPYVEAAFQASPECRLPFRILGFGQAVPSGFAATLENLLQSLTGRLTLETLQGLLESPLIADKFAFNEADEEGKTVIQWLADAQFRWGFTPEHRREFQNIPENRWNLLWALGRLGLGAIVKEGQRNTPLETTEPAHSTVPLERTSGLGLKLLAKLALFARRLQDAREQWSRTPARTILEWNQLASSLAETFLSRDDSVAGQHATDFQNKILPALNRANLEGLQLDAGAYRRLLTEKLALLTESSSRGPGGIQVADLRQYAGVPARMILITGLDDGAFPKRDERPDWHPLLKNPRPGDPSLRDSDRHALLLALLACGDRLVLSYRGNSDQDSKERPPSTALADLLEIVDQTTCPIQEGVPPHKQVLFSHPLNGFSPAAFSVHNALQQQGMTPSDHRAAQVLSSRETLSPLKGPWFFTQAPEENFPVSFQMLRKLILEPCALLLERLGIRLPEQAPELLRGDLLETGSLEDWAIKDELLKAFLEDQDPALVKKRLAASGKIPRGKLGDLVLFAADTKLKDLKDRLAAHVPIRPEARVVRKYRIEVTDTGGGGRSLLIEGTPKSGWYQIPGQTTLFYFSASSFEHSQQKRELSCLLEALGIVASADPLGPPPPTHLSAHFCDDTFEHPLPKPTDAIKALEQLLPLLRLARQCALPFWPDVENCTQWRKPNSNSNTPPVCDSPSTRYAFRGCTDPFLWRPEGLPDWLPNPAQPIALRISEFIALWKQSLGVATTTP